jgi:hypothetical protein
MTAAAYAKGTVVPVEKSKAEIDTLLGRHGALQRGIVHDEIRGVAIVGFTHAKRKYRIEVPLPSERDTSSRSPKSRRDQLEQLTRERWRGLLLLLRAKLEIVRLGASSIEREFLADLLLPDGATAERTIGEYMCRLVENGYEAPLQLPASTKGDAP